MTESRIFSLDLHARYACRHSGACCTAGWAIPVEPDRQTLLGGALLLPDPAGACRFFDRASKLCLVHRDHGERYLPDSCFHFPRRALIDDRGIFVSLSHFCPTAAGLIVDAPDRATIVEGPPAFPASRRYEGLDARGAWPPLIRPDVLFDMTGFTRWETFVVRTLGIAGTSPRQAVEHLGRAAERLRGWTPGTVPLEDFIEALETEQPADENRRVDGGRYAHLADVDAYDRVVAFVPDGLERPQLTAADRQALSTGLSTWGAFDGAARRYLAAKAFGSWAAYEARGVRTMVAELVVSELVLRAEAVRTTQRLQHPLDRAAMIEAVRAADWLLVHLVDRALLLKWLGDCDAS